MNKALLSSLLLLGLAACSEPFIVFSGGSLSGEEALAPADWSELETVEQVQLRNPPQRPLFGEHLGNRHRPGSVRRHGPRRHPLEGGGT